MRTETTSLQVPEWIATASSEGFDSRIKINTGWWTNTLAEAGLSGEAPPAVEGGLSRSQIFALAAAGVDVPETARRVLWASLAWGEGTRAFRNPGRVRSFLQAGDCNSALLVKAARLSKSNPVAAYELLNRKVKYLGPAFFTKYLYFAGGGDREHPSLILDARVAAALRDYCGWTSLRTGGSWPADAYGRYCDLLQRWSKELEQRGAPTTVGELEFKLFMRR